MPTKSCIITNNTKMGSIAYGDFKDAKYTIKDSPYLVIIPASEDSTDLKIDDKIEVIVITSKLKYNSSQIQIIGKLNK